MPEKFADVQSKALEEIEKKEEEERLKNTAASKILDIINQKPNTQTKKKINFRIDTNLYNQLSKLCAIKGITMVSVVSELIFNYLQENQDYLK